MVEEGLKTRAPEARGAATASESLTRIEVRSLLAGLYSRDSQTNGETQPINTKTRRGGGPVSPDSGAVIDRVSQLRYFPDM